MKTIIKLLDEVLNDTLNKKSSKRLAGLSCVFIGLILAVLIVAMDGCGRDLSVEIVRFVLSIVFGTGGALLGVGVIEKFGKDVTNRNTRENR